MHLGDVVTGVFMTALSAVVAGGGFAAAVLLRVRSVAAFGLVRTSWKWILVGVVGGIVATLLKIPATKEGLPAIEEMIARGRNINVTLIFSLERHMEVADAYIRGLERLVEAGGDPATVGSVASYFVSRVDTEADRRLDEAGHPELKGKLAVANAKLAYQNYKEKFSGERWQALAAKGATPQWCLWASTSTKNPEYRDVLYVEELIGPGTVNTMPRETIEAFQDHGEVALTLEQGIDEAKQVFEQVAAAGVDYDDVTDTLEREGVQKFIDSFTELLGGIDAKRKQLIAA